MNVRTIAGLSLGALLVYVAGVQTGIAVQRERTVPVQITAAPCIEERTQLCLYDWARKREVRVLGDGSVVYATPFPRATNETWSVP